MQSLLNSKNKRIGDSKSIYPIHVVDPVDNRNNVERDPAETVKQNFNTLLLYIIKMLMNNTKNPYDGFNVDNYLLFENSETVGFGENNKILSKVPALHKPDRSITTDKFDDIENLIKAQLSIHQESQQPDNSTIDQTRFSILNPNIHKGWSRDGDDTVLKTLIDNLINTNPSTKGGAKKKLNGGSQSQTIFQQIRDAQISDIEPFKKYASSIGKNDDYERMKKEITDTISNFESQYNKTSNYNKKVQIMAELSNSLFQQKIQTFQIFSRGAMKEIIKLRKQTQKFDIEKQHYEEKLTHINKQLLAKKNNYRNVSQVNDKLERYLKQTDSSNRRERREAAKQLLEVLKRDSLDENLRDNVIFLLNSTEIHNELSELLEISNSMPYKNFEKLKKSLQLAQEHILFLNEREKSGERHKIRLESENKELLSSLNKEKEYTHKVGRNLDTELHKNRLLAEKLGVEQSKIRSLHDSFQEERARYVSNLDELQERHKQQILQLESKHENTLKQLKQFVRVGQKQMNSQIQQQLLDEQQAHEEEIRRLQEAHQNELRILQEENISKVETTAQEAAKIMEEQIRKLLEKHEEDLSKLLIETAAWQQKAAAAAEEIANEQIRELENRHASQISDLEDRANAASAAASAAAVEKTTRDGKKAMDEEIKRLNEAKSKEIKMLKDTYERDRKNLLTANEQHFAIKQQQNDIVVSELNKKLETMQEKHKADLENLEQQKQVQLAIAAAAADEKLVQMGQENNVLLESADNTVRQLEGENNNLKLKFAKCEQRIVDLLEEQKRIVERSAEDRQENELRVKEFTDRIAEMKNIITNLESQISSKDKEMQTANVEYLRKTGATILELKNEINEILEQTQRELTDSKKEISRLEKELLKTNEDIKRIQRERDDCLQKLNTIKLENETLKQRIDEMTKTETSSTNEASSLKEQIETLVASQRKLKEEKEEAERTSTQRVTECIDSKISQLEEEYEGLKAKASQDTETFSQRLNEHVERSAATIKEKEEALDVLKQDKTKMETLLNSKVSDCEERVKKCEENERLCKEELAIKTRLVNDLGLQINQQEGEIQKKDLDIEATKKKSKEEQAETQNRFQDEE